MITYLPETPLIPPCGSGIKLGGAVPRDDQPGSGCSFLRDQPGFALIPPQDWAGIIAAGNNLSSFVWSILNQALVGSCASEAAAGGLKVVRRQSGLDDIEYNPYGAYGRVNGGRDNGSTLGGNLQFIRDFGAFPELVWPRSQGWRAKPSEEAYAAAKLNRLDEYYEVSSWAEIGTAVLNGWIVNFGLPGHSVLFVDMLNDLQGLYLNSWAASWGQKSIHNDIVPGGFGVASRRSVQLNYGVYAYRTPIVAAWSWL